MAAAWLAAASAVVALAAAVGPPPAAQLDSATVERAITIGRSGDRAALDRFRAAYRIEIGDALLERLDILTPFRRIVDAAAARPRRDNATWGPAQALEAIAPYRTRLSLVLAVRFPPQNAYVSMPTFDLVLHGRGTAAPIEPLDVRNTPLDVSGVAVPVGSPLVRGSVEAVFDLRRLDPRGSYQVSIRLQGRELRRTEIDLGRIE
jgi:hypothetical protein